MNLWRCDFVGADGTRCERTASGTGGAIGLRAIGWFFESGSKILCPAHRPDGTTLRTPDDWCTLPGPCGTCKGEHEALTYQYMIARQLEDIQVAAWAKQRLDRWIERADGKPL